MLHHDGKIPLIAAVKHPNQIKLAYDTSQRIARGQYYGIATRHTDAIPWQRFYNQQGTRVKMDAGRIVEFPGPKNEFSCLEVDGKGMAVFLGTEPDVGHGDYAREFIAIACK